MGDGAAVTICAQRQEKLALYRDILLRERTELRWCLTLNLAAATFIYPFAFRSLAALSNEVSIPFAVFMLCCCLILSLFGIATPVASFLGNYEFTRTIEIELLGGDSRQNNIWLENFMVNTQRWKRPEIVSLLCVALFVIIALGPVGALEAILESWNPENA